MPTVVREAGFSIIVRVRGENLPPHVHVYKGAGECRILLGETETGPRLWDVVGGMDWREARQAERLVIRPQAACRAVWRQVNGHLE